MIKSMTAVFALLIASMTIAQAADWPQWGGSASRNMVSSEKNLPPTFSFTSKNLSWKAKLGSHSYGSPVISGGKVFIGTMSNTPYDKRRSMSGGGAMACFDAKTGKFLWQLMIPQFVMPSKNFNFDKYKTGVCSTPVVEGNRLYFVSNRDELLCIDTNGMADGNAGPFKTESVFISDESNPAIPTIPTDGDIIWRIDMIYNKDIFAWPQDAADCSPLIVGNYIYVSPSNGVDRSHKKLQRPNAPRLIVVDKKTGRIVARDYRKGPTKIYHGEWSSPSAGKIGGRNLIFFGGGDGVCYAYSAKPGPAPKGQKLGSLNMVWKFDVNAAAKRVGRYNSATGPSEIVSTPVFYKNRVYVATGEDPAHGKGRAALACIDAAKKGDITKTGKIWVFTGIDRSVSTVAISGGLLYAADYSGRVFCLNPDTGKLIWQYDTEQPICASPMAVDGKVYVGTERGNLFTFAAGKKAQVLGITALGSPVTATPSAANGILYVMNQNTLFAASLPNNRK
ncbi:MAG: PQQ-binding-like beta-propeller repeat protein [Armatimonadetes bacterium]|nr:PQQ-binding-like beta-propeller repeat protein [Armatimonadota bacterium]